MSPFRDPTAAQIEVATRRLDELQRERKTAETRYRTACASLEAISRRIPSQPDPVPLPIRPRRLLAWTLVGTILGTLALLLSH